MVQAESFSRRASTAWAAVRANFDRSSPPGNPRSCVFTACENHVPQNHILGEKECYAGMVAAIHPHHLNVSEAIAERPDACPARTVSGENNIAAGRNVDFEVAAFCRQKDVLLLAPLQRDTLAIENVNEPRFSVLYVTGIAKVRDQNVELCQTHKIVSFFGEGDVPMAVSDYGGDVFTLLGSC